VINASAITSTRTAKQILAERLARRKGGLLDVRSQLLHFALITYAVPKARLEPFIPKERFEIAEFEIDGSNMALLSVVPFWDRDFRFVNIAPFLNGRFGQTNHRIYVNDKQNGEPCVWFLGTTLGSYLVHAARWLWRIPWHRANYNVQCNYNAQRKAYDIYRYHIQSDWCAGEIEIEDTGMTAPLQKGFRDYDEMILLLTHPVTGYFYRLDGKMGTYSVWHEKIAFTLGKPIYLYFNLYEKLGILSRDEMQTPHSILICPKTEFDVYLPPRAVK
jgi:hypothetical protein